MRSLFDSGIRAEILSRIRKLEPTANPRWGRFNVDKMLCHTADQLRIALGELPTGPGTAPLHYPVIKQLVVYWLPWPRGAKTAQELLATKPKEWESNRLQLEDLVERFGVSREPFAMHPIFGELSRQAWGVLAYRHLDHHLRQFGV